jgi:hypothetical protein
MALDADAAWPLKREVSFLLNQADVASPRGLFLALGASWRTVDEVKDLDGSVVGGIVFRIGQSLQSRNHSG